MGLEFGFGGWRNGWTEVQGWRRSGDFLNVFKTWVALRGIFPCIIQGLEQVHFSRYGGMVQPKVPKMRSGPTRSLPRRRMLFLQRTSLLCEFHPMVAMVGARLARMNQVSVRAVQVRTEPHLRYLRFQHENQSAHSVSYYGVSFNQLRLGYAPL